MARWPERLGLVLLLGVTLSCAHAPPRLAGLLDSGSVPVEVTQTAPAVNIFCVDVEAKAHARTHPREVAGYGSVDPVGLALFVPTAVLWNFGSDLAAAVARRSAIAAWLAPRGETSMAELEAAARVVVQRAPAAAAVRAALVEGAVATGREYGHLVFPLIAPKDAAEEGAGRIRLTPVAVELFFREGEAALALAAVFRAELVVQGSPTKSVVISAIDPHPRMLDAWLAQGGSPLREALVTLARQAGGTATFELLVSLDDVPRQRGGPFPLVRGLGPEFPDGTPLAPLALSRAGSWSDPRRVYHVVPTRTDSDDPVVAWERWQALDPLPAGVSIRYEFRLWTLPRLGPEDPPVFSIGDIEAPHQRLAGIVKAGETYQWSVRAVASRGSKRLATSWSCALVSPDDFAETSSCEPFRIEVGGPVARDERRPSSGSP